MHLLVNYTYKAISRVCHKLFAGRHFLPLPPYPDHLPFPRSGFPSGKTLESGARLLLFRPRPSLLVCIKAEMLRREAYDAIRVSRSSSGWRRT
jgi:hypothetical protein